LADNAIKDLSIAIGKLIEGFWVLEGQRNVLNGIDMNVWSHTYWHLVN
jgi:hypothetical protein